MPVHEIARMGPSGDDKIKWSTDDAAQIAAAEEAFAAMRNAGMTLFRKDPGGQHTRADHFDPQADFTAVPILVGG